MKKNSSAKCKRHLSKRLGGSEHKHSGKVPDAADLNQLSDPLAKLQMIQDSQQQQFK